MHRSSPRSTAGPPRCQATPRAVYARTVVPICASCGRESEGDSAFCPYCGAATTTPSRSTGAAQDRHGALLRRHRLDLARRVDRSRGAPRDPPPLLRADEGDRRGHGGTVEKFVGDAVMAVFGVPVLHEDDALRACRAAAEILEALPELGVRRGSVSTPARSSPARRSGSRPATPSTSPHGWRRPRRRATCSSARRRRDSSAARSRSSRSRRSTLKGKTEPVPHTASSRQRGAPAAARHPDGRPRERAARAAGGVRPRRHDRSCQLFTVLGSPGSASRGSPRSSSPRSRPASCTGAVSLTARGSRTGR